MAIEKIRVTPRDDFDYYAAEELDFKRLFTGEHLSISIDKYRPGQRTPKLYKRRPNNGKEILLPFQGKLKIMAGEQEFIADPSANGLTLYVIDALTERNFENVGDTDALVLVFFAPPFSVAEIQDFLVQTGQNQAA